MKLDDLSSKEQVFYDFFVWLFDDKRITDKNIDLEKEIDITLAPFYNDPNIYFPKQIEKFFETSAMQRLGRISQLDLSIDLYFNLYHNRLEHSKGVYYRKLEEMVYNFQNPNWKDKVEKENLKLYLIAELIKMAGHDIGHFPLSHAMEEQVYSCHGAHEVVGKRIMLENPEINQVYTEISPELPEIMHEIYEKDIWNFREHDESSYDVDRLDYLQRDNIYWGTPVHLPYLQYETVQVEVDNSNKPQKNNDGSIISLDSSKNSIDVYSYENLQDIEHFLSLRESGYINKIYSVPYSHVREASVGIFFKAFLESPSVCGKDLRHYITVLQTQKIEDIDLNLLLGWDEVKFYSEIIDIAQNHEDENIRQLATLTIPKLDAFLNILYSSLNIHAKKGEYSEQEKTLLKKVKKIISGNSELSQNLKNPDFIRSQTLFCNNPSNESIDINLQRLLEQNIIFRQNKKVKAYNPKEPIYVRSSEGKIYELSEHPERTCNWAEITTTLNSIFTYIPYLKYSVSHEDELTYIKNYFNRNGQDFDAPSHETKINMQPLQVGNSLKNVFEEIEL